LAKASLVAATLATTYSSPLLYGLRFDTVIVDEASMAVLPELFYAACLASKQAIMIGDPRQLSPIVLSEDRKVRRALGRNIFDVRVPAPHDSDLVVMLDTQYRMHPRIGDLVSTLFYSGRLQHGPATADHQSISDHAPYPGKSLVVVDTRGLTSCQRAERLSRVNMATAALCAELAVEAWSAGHKSVGVITPYAAQATEIRRRLPRDAEAAIDCSTIHRFQGSERDVVIIDLVDTDAMPPGRLLCGTDEQSANLLNVSLSRARGKLVIVADVASFERRLSTSVVTNVLRHAVAHGTTVYFQPRTGS
jgi:superfamily I DNA and/or RNA helicase